MLAGSLDTRILIYNESKLFNEVDKVGSFIHEILGFSVEKKGEFLRYHSSNLDQRELKVLSERLSLQIVQSRVKLDPSRRRIRDYLQAEVEFERRWLFNQSQKPHGMPYDGYEIQRLLQCLINEDEKDLRNLHIIITDQLLMTKNIASQRYHARYGIYGIPSIISISGIVEAPAKPREYYVESKLGTDPEELKRKYRGKFIDYGDERMVEVVKGISLQSIIYLLTGEAFCESKACRFFNAHWQQDLISSQTAGGNNFCDYHKGLITQIKEASKRAVSI